MTIKDDQEIIIITESARESWSRDASTVVAFVTMIGIGVFLESTALQWVGAILGFLHIIGRATRLFKDNRYTIEQARKRLDELEAK